MLISNEDNENEKHNETILFQTHSNGKSEEVG